MLALPARDALIEDPSSEKSLRLATIMSVIAMSVPCSPFLVAVPGEMMSSGVGQGTGFVAFFFIIFLPFPGILDGLLAAGSRVGTVQSTPECTLQIDDKGGSR